MRLPRLPIGLAVASIATAACYDPVHLDAVATLGGEAPDVPAGPFHRPGQPCLTCHGSDGPSRYELSAGGTVYAVRGQLAPFAGAKVTLKDGTGETRTVTTNAAGNFFVKRSEWDLAFPLSATVEEPNGIRREMTTVIGRDASCATCHREKGDSTHMPAIFLRDK